MPSQRISTPGGNRYQLPRPHAGQRAPPATPSAPCRPCPGGSGFCSGGAAAAGAGTLSEVCLCRSLPPPHPATGCPARIGRLGGLELLARYSRWHPLQTQLRFPLSKHQPKVKGLHLPSYLPILGGSGVRFPPRQQRFALFPAELDICRSLQRGSSPTCRMGGQRVIFCSWPHGLSSMLPQTGRPSPRRPDAPLPANKSTRRVQNYESQARVPEGYQSGE